MRHDLADVVHGARIGLCDACDAERAARDADACESASLYRVAPFADD